MEQFGHFIINHWVLWLALVAVLALILINEAVSKTKKAKELTPAAAVGLINHQDAVIVDLRDKQAYQSGHIINAIQASEEDFKKEKMRQYKHKPLILVCAKGMQASIVAARLREQGFEQTNVLSGGMAGWTAANLPVVKG